MNIVIYLIEDRVKDMRDILEKLNAFAQNKKSQNNNYIFQFKPLKGTVAKRCYEDDWVFYEPRVIEDIRDRKAEEEEKGNKMGLLLDILLTKADIDYSRSKYYPKASIASKIYSEFHEKMPIYIITNILNFGTQSDIIMDADLRDSFILKGCLEYPGDVYVKSMFDKYIKIIEEQGDLK